MSSSTKASVKPQISPLSSTPENDSSAEKSTSTPEKEEKTRTPGAPKEEKNTEEAKEPEVGIKTKCVPEHCLSLTVTSELGITSNPPWARMTSIEAAVMYRTLAHSLCWNWFQSKVG